MILGNGTNTLFADGMFAGVVVRLGDSFQKAGPESATTGSPFSPSSGKIAGGRQEMQPPCTEAATVGAPPEMQPPADDAIWCCGAAASLSTLARRFLEAGLTGFEFAAGIPGSLGGAVYMNAGAYGGEMRDVLVGAEGIAPDGRTVRVFRAADLDLSYRHSALMETGYILTRVWLRLRRGDRATIRARMQELAARRSEKQPLQYPSAGSTFKRPSGGFAAKLIEEADLKGVSVGGAQVSTLHSGFIINTGEATATDILDLMHLVQNTVYDRFGVKLEPEVRIVGQEGILGDTGGMA